MGPRKGLSFEDKRERLLEIFTGSAEFYTIKELEKIAPKQKGIVPQSVKEVLMSLVNDDIVSSDKCGTQTVFWCLPSEAVLKERARLKVLQQEAEGKAAKESELKKQLARHKAGREESEERSLLLSSIKKRREQLQILVTELQMYAECDPSLQKSIITHTGSARTAANRWTDNIFEVESWIRRKFNMSRQDFYTRFEIPEDLDYVEA